MLLEPGAEKLEQLDRDGGAAGFEILLELDDLCFEGFVLGFVLGEFGVVVKAHQPLFVREVYDCVLDETIQNSGKGGLTLASHHGVVQLTAHGKEILVLPIDAADTDAVVRSPIKHAHHIG
jgi:hypothetical protein